MLLMALRVKITGLDKLQRMRKTLASDFVSKGAEVGAEECLNLVAQGFRRGTDPYGTPWDAPHNLQITGGIRRYTKVVRGKRWVVMSTDQKAIWHHAPRPRAAWGGKALPTRLQVPTKARGWPASWRKRVSAAVKRGILAALKSR